MKKFLFWFSLGFSGITLLLFFFICISPPPFLVELIFADKLNINDNNCRVIVRLFPVNARDPYGNTSLIWAVLQKDTETVKFLISKKADVNARLSKGD